MTTSHGCPGANADRTMRLVPRPSTRRGAGPFGVGGALGRGSEVTLGATGLCSRSIARHDRRDELLRGLREPAHALAHRRPRFGDGVPQASLARAQRLLRGRGKPPGGDTDLRRELPADGLRGRQGFRRSPPEQPPRAASAGTWPEREADPQPPVLPAPRTGARCRRTRRPGRSTKRRPPRAARPADLRTRLRTGPAAVAFTTTSRRATRSRTRARVDACDGGVGPGHRLGQAPHRLHRVRVQFLDASGSFFAGTHELGVQLADALAVLVLGVDPFPLDLLLQLAYPLGELGLHARSVPPGARPPA